MDPTTNVATHALTLRTTYPPFVALVQAFIRGVIAQAPAAHAGVGGVGAHVVDAEPGSGTAFGFIPWDLAVVLGGYAFVDAVAALGEEGVVSVVENGCLGGRQGWMELGEDERTVCSGPAVACGWVDDGGH